MESQKYGVGGTQDEISTDGGPLASVYEKGTKLGLEPLDYGDNSLVGYWPVNEATGTIAYDYSGSNATGSWNGAQAGTSGYYSQGKVQTYAGYFDGSTDYVNIGTKADATFAGTNAWTITGWAYYSGSYNGYQSILGSVGSGGVWLGAAPNPEMGFNGWGGFSASSPLSTGWHFLVGTRQGSVWTIYADGIAVAMHFSGCQYFLCQQYLYW